MKLNLLLGNQKGILNGYQNIDPLKGKIEDCRIEGDIVSLDWIVDDSECEQIIARNILEYFPIPSQGTILHNWLKKIKRGGEFIYEQVDFEAVCCAVYMGKLVGKDAQAILYGAQDKNWNVKKSGLTMGPLADFLEGSGFKVTQKRWNELNFVINATRI